MANLNIEKLEEHARNIRINSIKAIHEAGSGHPGGSLSSADILSALYMNVMNIDPENPNMPERDRFVLSKGHAAPALYAALGERGFFPVEEMMSLRKIDSDFQGHPSMLSIPGVDMSTGSLGQGFSAAVGMATALKIDDNPAHVYVLLGDGELQEGIVWEAAMSAAHRKLGNLVAIVDWNGLQIDGRVDDVKRVNPIDEKFATFGWYTIMTDGHDMRDIVKSLVTGRKIVDRPVVIIAKTVKGKGVSFMENEAGWHGKAPDDEQFKKAMKELGGEIHE